MLFKWLCVVQCGRVEAQGDCPCVLICHVECVVQIHDEGVTVQTQAILDVRIIKPGVVKGVCRSDVDGVAGPRK